MDRGGAWWAAVHGVARSPTWLSNFTYTFHFHALEKEMATHSSVLAWRIPAMAEPGGLPSLGLQWVGHDWSDLAAAAAVHNKVLREWTQEPMQDRQLPNLTGVRPRPGSQQHSYLLDYNLERRVPILTIIIFSIEPNRMLQTKKHLGKCPLNRRRSYCTRGMQPQVKGFLRLKTQAAPELGSQRSSRHHGCTPWLALPWLSLFSTPSRLPSPNCLPRTMLWSDPYLIQGSTMAPCCHTTVSELFVCQFTTPASSCTFQYVFLPVSLLLVLEIGQDMCPGWLVFLC